jgi:hypothetical protein
LGHTLVNPLPDTALKIPLAVYGLFNLGLKSGGRTLAVNRTSSETDSVRNESRAKALYDDVSPFFLTRPHLDGLAPL